MTYAGGAGDVKRASRGGARRSVRLLGCALALAGLMGAAACSGESAAPEAKGTPSASPSRTAPACPASGVKVKGLGVSAATGARGMGIALVNCGSRPYQVNGYPGLRVLDESKKAVQAKAKVKVQKGTTSIKDAGPRAITLQPGEEAKAGVFWRNTVDRVDVAATNGAYLEVIPAPGQEPQAVKELIDIGTTGKLEVTAWEKAAPPPKGEKGQQ